MVFVARRYRQSPVFYEPTPTRWPWVLAFLLVVCAIVFAAVVRPGIVPLGGLGELLPQRNTAPQIAPSADPEIAGSIEHERKRQHQQPAAGADSIARLVG